ncbi:DegT/DnrJ/EryC1/StrS family aminotransferase [Ekhidna sp.]
MEPDLSGNEKTYLIDAIDSGWISSKGKYVDQFEKEFAAFHEVDYALAVSNGTVALHLGLVSLGIGKGDEVIVPNLTFASSVNAIIHAGATPVLAEVDAETYNIDCNKLDQYISSKTKAIMPVHLYGNPCDMDEICTIANKHGLLIIEDNAEGLGSTYKKKIAGSFGDVSTFSFYGNKTITTGEGGAILFKNQKTFEYAKVLRDHGMSPDRRYWHEHIGFNYRLTNMQAAIGCAQLEHIQDILQKKSSIVKRYVDGLAPIGSIKFQKTEAGSLSSNWLFTPLFKNVSTNDLSQYLHKHGVETRPAFYPISTMPVYSDFKKGGYDVSESVSKSGLSLPSFPTLKNSEVDLIIAAIKKFYD